MKIFSLTLIISSILMNLLCGRSNVRMQFNSKRFRFCVSDCGVLNINFVIINDWTFSVQGNHGCLQSFNFNFLFRDGELSLGIKLVYLRVRINIILRLVLSRIYGSWLSWWIISLGGRSSFAHLIYYFIWLTKIEKGLKIKIKFLK